MSFEGRETSVEDGAPIELYTFSVYGQLYRFTTAAEDQIVDAQTYDAWGPISRSAPEASNSIERNNLTITVQPDFPITTFYQGTPPSTVVLLTIARVHRGDHDPHAFWSGRVLSCRWEGARAILHCENIFTSLRRPGLRRLYGRGCPYELYGPECRAVEADHRVDVQLTAAVGQVLEAPDFATFADGRLAGGFVSWEPVAGQVLQRAIMSHVGDSIRITHPIEGLTGGTIVQVHPGCLHTLEDCEDFFDNIENYGGLAPFLAAKNPFGGNSVF